MHPIEFILEGVGCDSYHLLESTGLVLGVEVVSPQLKVLHFILFTKKSQYKVCQGALLWVRWRAQIHFKRSAKQVPAYTVRYVYQSTKR